MFVQPLNLTSQPVQSPHSLFPLIIAKCEEKYETLLLESTYIQQQIYELKCRERLNNTIFQQRIKLWYVPDLKGLLTTTQSTLSFAQHMQQTLNVSSIAHQSAIQMEQQAIQQQQLFRTYHSTNKISIPVLTNQQLPSASFCSLCAAYHNTRHQHIKQIPPQWITIFGLSAAQTLWCMLHCDFRVTEFFLDILVQGNQSKCDKLIQVLRSLGGAFISFHAKFEQDPLNLDYNEFRPSQITRDHCDLFWNNWLTVAESMNIGISTAILFLIVLLCR